MDQQQEQGPRLDYRIPAHRRERVEERLTRLTKRARRKGIEVIEWTWGEPEIEQVRVPDDFAPGGERTVSREWHPLHLSGRTMRLMDWSFVARLDHGQTPEGQWLTISYAAPGQTVPPQYANSAPNCDHCRLDRNRRDTFIVRHPEKGFRQVGSSCLRDHLGIDPDTFLSWAEYLGDIYGACSDGEGIEGGGGWRISHVPAERVLEAAAALLTGSGFWLSSRKAYEESRTGSGATVREWLTMRVKTDKDAEYRRNLIDPDWFTEESKALATETAAWIASLGQPQDIQSEYLRNLRTMQLRTDVPLKAIPTFASAVYSYQREMGRLKRREQAMTASKNSRYQGEPGQRIGIDEPITVTVAMARGYEGNYGAGTILILIDEQGNRYKWFASLHYREAPRQGETLPMIATVKSHEPDDYAGGAPTTLISRAIFDAEKIQKTRARRPKKK